MSGLQFVISSSSTLGLCSRTMITNTPASTYLNGSRKTKLRFFEWPSQSLDLNPIEMLWHDLKQSIHARKPSNVAELKVTYFIPFWSFILGVDVLKNIYLRYKYQKPIYQYIFTAPLSGALLRTGRFWPV